MSIFDPIGLLSFFTVQMKILLQKVWRMQIGWDEQISEELSEEWMRWLSMLKNVESTEIPRCYFANVHIPDREIQLHIFVDASENAYAAVGFFRVESSAGVETALVAAKTKVGPLGIVSIPRMELLAALLGARLATSIRENHDLVVNSTYYWSDSKTVLSWVKSDPRRYKQFVMYRIAEIQETTEISNWKYIPSKQNVADLGTKWVKPNFDKSSPWFSGPTFLKKPPNEWPDVSSNKEPCIDEHLQIVAVHHHQKEPLIDFYRFSKYERLLRSIAFVKKFFDIRKVSKSQNTDLTSEQLKFSESFLIKVAQFHAYFYEISLLQNNPSCVLPKSSELRKLSPFVDQCGILRMRGRLENATIIGNDTKNPIILPRNHHITHLLVDSYHRKFKHIHHETVVNEIFQRYHIFGLRHVLRTIRTKCAMCRLRDAKPCPPEMAPLPSARVTAYTKPFSFVGVDFFGPFLVTVGRRSEKRYGVVFTCLAIRAIHVEVAYSLDTNSCIIAIRNFISRRGPPLEMFSDNGTNLRAAEKELREAHDCINFPAISKEFTGPNMKWTFIPPASPHMGGSWERMVRSIKTVLYQIISPDHKLNDERLHNLFLEVESIINSRPLTYLSLDSAEQEALTPNHFLLGSSSGAKPPGMFDVKNMLLKQSWRHSQVLADKFWSRWVSEFLPTITKRTKWFEKAKPICVGDVVIIVDPNLPRHCWPKGVVQQTMVAKDGQVRSVEVKTANGVYHRPAAKIALLDIKN